MMKHDIATPSLVIDGCVVRQNLSCMASYAAEHGLALRPHTKTHKSLKLAKIQLDSGAVGLTVAKVGEALIMAQVSDDLLMAYPAVNLNRAVELGKLASTRSVRVTVDSSYCIKVLGDAARSTGSTIGILVELDVGMGRMGVQTAKESLALAQEVDKTQGLRLDGIMFYPGQVVIDAGSKTLSSDLCHGRADSGYGYICEYSQAKIFKLYEEHGLVDITACDVRPKVGQTITVIPNHICVCVNLQNVLWWHEKAQPPEQIIVDARGQLT
jgi:D-serine deaminase-like pyridoxal phosphate-dependent protein